MALFGSKKNTEKKGDKPEKKPKGGAAAKRDLSHVLRQPRITEKATHVSEDSNVYVFEVAPKATKRDIADAVRLYYKADAVKVNVASIPSKQVFMRGKWGVKSGGRKAYVYLKKGQTIEIL